MRAEWKPSSQVSERELFEHLRATADGAPATSNEVRFVRASCGRRTRLRTSRTPRWNRARQWRNGRTISLRFGQAPSGRLGCGRNSRQPFGLPEERVRVIIPDTGSGYGGKHTGEAAIEAARLARGAGQPGQAGLDARRRVHLGVFPSGRRDRHSGGRSMRTDESRGGSTAISTPATRALACSTMSRKRSRSSIDQSRRCDRARIARSRPRPITSLAKRPSTNSRQREAGSAGISVEESARRTSARCTPSRRRTLLAGVGAKA